MSYTNSREGHVMYVVQAAKSGAKFTALTSLIAAIGFSMAGASGNNAGWLPILLILYVPLLAGIGAIAGFVIFAIAAAFVRAAGLERSVGAPGYALLGTIFSLLGLLPHMAWVAGGVAAALAGHKGTYEVLFPGMLAAAVAGVLVGRKLSSGHGMSQQESVGHLDQVVARHLRQLQKQQTT